MNKLSFISFDVKDGHFIGSLSLDIAFKSEEDPEVTLREATKVYEKSIQQMRSLVTEMRTLRSNRKTIPARIIWNIGDTIFELKYNLEKLGLELDDLYQHLVRDLVVKRKWLEKVVILRRYIPKGSIIPKTLTWTNCEKGTRRVAEALTQKYMVNR